MVEVSEVTLKKPLMGVTPEKIWIQERVEEISECIYNHIKGGYIGGGYLVSLKKWMSDLNILLDKLDKLNGEKS